MDLTLETEHGKLNIRVAAWIENERNILCATFPDGTISLPGGRVQFGESTLDAIQREVYEETGERFASPNLFAIIENFFAIEQQPFHEFLYVYKGGIALKDSYVGEDIGQKIHWLHQSEIHRLKPAVFVELSKLNPSSGVAHLVQVEG